MMRSHYIIIIGLLAPFGCEPIFIHSRGASKERAPSCGEARQGGEEEERKRKWKYFLPPRELVAIWARRTQTVGANGHQLAGASLAHRSALNIYIKNIYLYVNRQAEIYIPSLPKACSSAGALYVAHELSSNWLACRHPKHSVWGEPCAVWMHCQLARSLPENWPPFGAFYNERHRGAHKVTKRGGAILFSLAARSH